MDGLKSVKGSIRRGTRRTVSDDQKGWVTVRPLFDDKAIPIVIEPTVSGIDVVSWMSNNKEYVESLLLEHRALLFRGFEIENVGIFEAVVDSISNSQPLEYRDRTTPRAKRGTKSYTSTVHPSDQVINLHNEGTYWTQWAQKLFFYCIQCSDEGGQTPIADVRNVYKRIPQALKDKFKALDWQLIRNFNDGFGLTWQEVFQTEIAEEVEQYCRANDIQFNWTENGRLSTRQTRLAVRYHPITGEPVWFNHAAFFHYTTLEKELRETLLQEFGQENLPYNTCFGNNEPISAEEADVLQQAYKAEKIKFDWQASDILLLDNMSIAHGREPYKGEREVLVAMTDPVSDSDPSQQV
ncbi:MAG: alpha-ketoglutarate-dependent taurine dioxygenase [Gammaproteobacteria bacterium]|jgi:alpha-ketoglutarate-dependent taurine dioxygenase